MREHLQVIHDSEQRKKREREFLLLIALFLRAMQAQSAQFIAGDIDRGEYLNLSLSILRWTHFRAACLGAAHAQGPSKLRVRPDMIAEVAAQSQIRFLAGFTSDMANGRYAPAEEGGAGKKALAARFSLYARALLGTANQAWLAVLAATGTEVRWQLGATDDHCKDCIDEARKGWRSARSLTRVPGDGKTQCLTCCQCWLETSEGFTSLKLPGKI